MQQTKERKNRLNMPIGVVKTEAAKKRPHDDDILGIFTILVISGWWAQSMQLLLIQCLNHHFSDGNERRKWCRVSGRHVIITEICTYPTMKCINLYSINFSFMYCYYRVFLLLFLFFICVHSFHHSNASFFVGRLKPIHSVFVLVATHPSIAFIYKLHVFHSSFISNWFLCFCCDPFKWNNNSAREKKVVDDRKKTQPPYTTWLNNA